ncbi:MAG TPA: hypothetical protein ENN80_15230, partial [Candidatus Hydrogenedentes bacterium]|nr:hypothetical protein [Candidatus Hydrogenedentota bacterium]
MERRKGERHQAAARVRVLHVGAALLVVCAVLSARLWQLQVIQTHQYREMAEHNRLHPQRLKARRGTIYGRDGLILADNRPACDVVLVPADCGEPEAVCAKLASLLDVDAEALQAAISAQRHHPFEQIVVKRDVTRTDLIRVEEHAYALPGVFTVVNSQRRYIFGTTGGQLLGYLGEIGPKELEQRKDRYTMGDYIGRSGLEQQYEPVLHGTDGHTVVTRYAWGRPQLRTDLRGNPYIAARDSYGHELEEAYRLDPVPGNPVYLTLDIHLQAKAEELLREEVGAIVVLEADTGAVLALASTPGYDPSVFVMRGCDRERRELLNAGRPQPMVNRAYREMYP